MNTKTYRSKEFAETVERVKAINDELKAKGLEWKEIDRFWTDCIIKAQNAKKISPDAN